MGHVDGAAAAARDLPPTRLPSPSQRGFAPRCTKRQPRGAPASRSGLPGVPMASSTVTLVAADGFQFPAHVSEPAAKPRGAVVVLQEIFGINAHIRSVADRFAAAGYLAIAPALFERVERGIELGYGPADMQRGSALKAAIEAL